MPGLDWGYEGGGPGGAGVAGVGQPTGTMLIAVGIPQVPLFYPAQARTQIGKIALDTLRLALMDIAGHVSDKAGAFSDTGALAQSFGADPATPTGGIELLGTDVLAGVSGRVFSSLPYAIVMEHGRRAGSPINKAGIDAIGLWAQRKLGLTSAEAKSAKYAIANSIMVSGIPAKEYAQAGFDAARPGIELMFADLAQTISAALTGAAGTR